MKKMLIIIGSIILALITIEIVAILLLRSQIGRYDDFWRTEAQLPREDSSLLYVALGDSAAQGIGATHPKRGYVGLLARSLEQESNQPVHIVNLSKTGATLTDCLTNQLPILKEMKPDIVTIEIGANDMRTFDPERFRAQMDELMSQLPPGTIISDMPYFGGGRANQLEKNALEANKIINDLVKNYDLQLAQLHDEIKQNDHLNTYAADFFHPSNAGYKNWRNAFWQALNKR